MEPNTFGCQMVWISSQSNDYDTFLRFHTSEISLISQVTFFIEIKVLQLSCMCTYIQSTTCSATTFTKLKTKVSQHNLLQNCKNLTTNILQGIATLVPMHPTIIKLRSIVYTRCPRYCSTCHWGHKYAHVIFYSKKEKISVWW